MKRFFWKFNNRFRNYPESKYLDTLIDRCINLIENCPNVNVRVTQYYIFITTSSSEIELWNENKFHAWLSSGRVNGRKFSEVSPSLDKMYDFKEFLKHKGYDIYVKGNKHQGIISIDDVKC